MAVNVTPFVNFLPKQGLIVNPTGGVYPNTGCIDAHPIIMGDITPVANAETDLIPTDPTLNPRKAVPNGILDVSMCSIVALYIDFVLGSLTSADLIPYFGVPGVVSTIFYKRGWPSVAAGIITLTPLTYRFTASYSGVIILNNPSTNYLKLRTASVGTTTTSSITVIASRSGSSMGNILAG